MLAHFTNESEADGIRNDSSFSIKAISESATRRIVKYAFDYTRANTIYRKKVTAVHKGNILKYTDGLFLSAAAKVARDYPDIEFESVIVDSLCMQLMRTPQRYDVLVMPSRDIVSELYAGLIGGLELTPTANREERAIAQIIAEGKSVTYDMKPDHSDPTAVGTSQVADAVIQRMKE